MIILQVQHLETHRAYKLPDLKQDSTSIHFTHLFETTTHKMFFSQRPQFIGVFKNQFYPKEETITSNNMFLKIINLHS